MFHILLAEDDANLRHVVEKTLRSAGYTVARAEDGRAAWDMFCHEQFDLVITDVMMPCMDGNALTAAVRRQSRDTPVLMLTALEAIDDKEKGFTSGADDYLVKPFVLRECSCGSRRCCGGTRRYRRAGSCCPIPSWTIRRAPRGLTGPRYR